MPRTRCPHCQTVQTFEEEDRGTVQHCSSCDKTFRAPGALRDKAVQPEPKPAPKTDTAAKRRPPDEDDVTELDEVTEDDDDDLDEVTATDDDEDRPRRRSKDDGKSRRKKKKKRRPPEGFSLVDTVPIDYGSQVNLGVGFGILFYLVAFAGTGMVSRSSPLFLLLIPTFLLAELCFLWGCAAYAKNKNQSQWFGLLGLLGLLGLIILVCLPYRQEEEQ